MNNDTIKLNVLPTPIRRQITDSIITNLIGGIVFGVFLTIGVLGSAYVFETAFSEQVKQQ